MIDLDKLQETWEKDSKIDMDNFHTESTNIPTLHAKYFENVQHHLSDEKESRTTEERI